MRSAIAARLLCCTRDDWQPLATAEQTSRARVRHRAVGTAPSLLSERPTSPPPVQLTNDQAGEAIRPSRVRAAIRSGTPRTPSRVSGAVQATARPLRLETQENGDEWLGRVGLGQALLRPDGPGHFKAVPPPLLAFMSAVPAPSYPTLRTPPVSNWWPLFSSCAELSMAQPSFRRLQEWSGCGGQWQAVATGRDRGGTGLGWGRQAGTEWHTVAHSGAARKKKRKKELVMTA